MSTLDSVFRTFAERYLGAKTEPLKGHPLSAWFKSEVVTRIEELLGRSDLSLEASIGQGNWAEIPWIGCFNPESTDSATSGLYVVYLFSADMSSVFLCQGQGVTKVRHEFKRDTVAELTRRSSLIRSRVPSYAPNFNQGPISLGGSTNLAKDYDPAVVWFKKYDLGNLPPEETLASDLKAAIGLYDLVLARGGTENIETAMTFIAQDDSTNIDEERKKVRHTKLERNRKTSKKVKSAQGYTCKGCEFNFETTYGERGREYIEAHHLLPLSSLKEGEVVSMNVLTDFAVLCSNCHSIVHRGENLLTLEELINLPGVKRLRLFHSGRS